MQEIIDKNMTTNAEAAKLLKKTLDESTSFANQGTKLGHSVIVNPAGRKIKTRRTDLLMSLVVDSRS